MPRRTDALELLEADHQTVRKLFKAYAALTAHGAPPARRRALAEQICMELTLHARLEEELLYPSLRQASREDDLLDEAEHAGARELIAQILSMKPRDELYDAKVAVLGRYVEHHAANERSRLFPRMRASRIDLMSLGQRLRQRRRELRSVQDALREEALASLTA